IIEEVGCQASKGLFFRVATELFADGNFNWGRVVTLFYFACKLVLKSLRQQIPELVRTILGWTLEFLRERVLAWIQAQGGWEGSYRLPVINTLPAKHLPVAKGPVGSWAAWARAWPGGGGRTFSPLCSVPGGALGPVLGSPVQEGQGTAGESPT
uniref:Bcl-2 Bcl-2 homology region 1-3 domain-containing protein n=1 Tax=Calidris pygmaea TaxID=425635 RepID=A0A8C3J127_9CHAR